MTARVPSDGTALKEGVVYEYDLTFAFDDGAVQTLVGATPNTPVDPARENGGGNGVIPVSTRLTTRAEASESTAGSSVEVAPRA